MTAALYASSSMEDTLSPFQLLFLKSLENVSQKRPSGDGDGPGTLKQSRREFLSVVAAVALTRTKTCMASIDGTLVAPGEDRTVGRSVRTLLLRRLATCLL